MNQKVGCQYFTEKNGKRAHILTLISLNLELIDQCVIELLCGEVGCIMEFFDTFC